MSVLVKNRICHIAVWLCILSPASIWGEARSSSVVLLSASGSSNLCSTSCVSVRSGDRNINSSIPLALPAFAVSAESTIDCEQTSLSKAFTPQQQSQKAIMPENSGKTGVTSTIATSLPDSNNKAKNGWQFVAGTAFQSNSENPVAENRATGGRTVLMLTAPSNPITDDAADTFDWTYSPGYELPELYEYTLDGGTLYQPVTAKPQPVGNNAYSVGQVGVRVKASATHHQSTTLYNDVAFFVAPENLLPHSDFSFGFPFHLYNGSTEPSKNIASPVKNTGTYYKSSANGSQTEIRVFQYPNIDNEAVTYSMYIKPVTIDTLTLNVHGSVGGPIAEISFQLSTKAVVSYLNGSGLITAVADQSGWYRVAFTYVSSTSTSGILRILFPETTSNSQKAFYLAGAQLNRGVTSGTFVAK